MAGGAAASPGTSGGGTVLKQETLRETLSHQEGPEVRDVHERQRRGVDALHRAWEIRNAQRNVWRNALKKRRCDLRVDGETDVGETCLGRAERRESSEWTEGRESRGADGRAEESREGEGDWKEGM